MSTQTRKTDSNDHNPAAAHAAKVGERKGMTSAAELDQPDEITPANTVLYGECRSCGTVAKLDEGGKVLPHRVHGHGAPDDDPICDGAGKTPA